MNLLNVSVIIDGKIIYPVEKEKSIVIPVDHNYPSVVATDGFHITNPIRLTYRNSNTCHLKLLCAVDDDQLWAGLLLLVILFLVGGISDVLILKIFSFTPILYFLFYYYIKRKEFLQVKMG